MARLTKAQSAKHNEAVKILEQDRLSEDDREFVFDHWQESAHHMNGLAGAFFTPRGLAHETSVWMCGGRVIDLCAGIGILGYHAMLKASWDGGLKELVCVEINPDYVAVGKKLVPEARWIQASVFNLPSDLGKFDMAIGNPPFGAVPRDGFGPRYTGRHFEFGVIDAAADLARYGVFIVPQGSSPTELSGRNDPRHRHSEAYERFREQTGITLQVSSSDTSIYRNDWRMTSPAVEIVTADFDEMEQVKGLTA